MPEQNTKKVIRFNFSGDALEELRGLLKLTGLSKADLIQHSLSLMKFMYTETKIRNGIILIEKNNGKIVDLFQKSYNS